jgi:hypothetical protein
MAEETEAPLVDALKKKKKLRRVSNTTHLLV